MSMVGKPSSLFDEYNIDWAPSVDLGHDGTAPSVSNDRHNRAVLRERNKQLQMVRIMTSRL